jgi:rubrerythrin
MQTVLKGELLARAKYLAYAGKAREEKYPHIAYLSVALGASEGIHARNFQKVLADLGSPAEAVLPVVTVSDTRTNIKLASTAELEEIDTKYPRFIQRITPERCEEAIADLTHAWLAEKQHRDLIMQLIQGSGILFGVMARTIEGTPVDYFVCQACGSTLVELPRDRCPVCSGPVSNYRKVDPAP